MARATDQVFSPDGAPGGGGEQEAFPFGKVRSEEMSRKEWDSQVLYLVEKLAWKGAPSEPRTAALSGAGVDGSRGAGRASPRVPGKEACDLSLQMSCMAF